MTTAIKSIRSKRARKVLTILFYCVLIPIVILAIALTGHSKDEDGDDKAKPREDKHEKPINTDFDLFSMGKNGDYSKRLDNKKSADDIVRASNGEYVGLASEY